MLEGVRVLAIHHDAGLNGAALLFQSVLEGLARDHGMSISAMFPREGAILARARQLGPVHVAAPLLVEGPTRILARVSRALGRATAVADGVPCDLIFANSAASLPMVEGVQTRNGLPLVVYVHESNYMLRHVCDLRAVTRVLRRADLIFAVSASVRKTLEDVIRPSARIAVVSGFVPVRPPTVAPQELPSAVRTAISSGARIVGGVGTMSWYKGTDLFIAVARRVRQLLPQQPLLFAWIGEEWYPAVRPQLEHDVKMCGLEDIVILPGRMEDPTVFFQTLSLFLLPSREDSWPLAMLEAASQGVPTICFQGAGGAEQFLGGGGGTAVPYLDVEAMAQAAARYLSAPELMARDSRIAREIGRAVTSGGQIGRIAEELKAMLARNIPR
jgi:glycosyltransferase involved in cell wall biosynthesis